MSDSPNTLQPDAKQRWAAGSALFYAVDHQNLPLAQAMVKAGADLNQLDSHGKTAMRHAVSRNVARGFVNGRVDAELSGTDRARVCIDVDMGCDHPYCRVRGLIASGFLRERNHL